MDSSLQTIQKFTCFYLFICLFVILFGLFDENWDPVHIYTVQAIIFSWIVD